MSCAAALAEREIGGRIRHVCPSCGWTFWDNPTPAAGAVVVRGGTVLLCRRARPPREGLWDLPGGILERDESAEDGLLRELREELGVSARVEGLVGTWPGSYGGRPTLNLLYEAVLDGTPQAHDDVAEVRWWPLEALPELAWDHEADCLRLVTSRSRSRAGLR